MIVDSYCCECRKVQEFTIVQNIGPALVPLFCRHNPPPPGLYTSESAPGYEVSGVCAVEHLDANGERIAKWIVISRWRTQGISRPRYAKRETVA